MNLCWAGFLISVWPKEKAAVIGSQSVTASLVGFVKLMGTVYPSYQLAHPDLSYCSRSKSTEPNTMNRLSSSSFCGVVLSVMLYLDKKPLVKSPTDVLLPNLAYEDVWSWQVRKIKKETFQDPPWKMRGSGRNGRENEK